MLLHNALEIYPKGFSVLEELNYYYVVNYTLIVIPLSANYRIDILNLFFRPSTYVFVYRIGAPNTYVRNLYLQYPNSITFVVGILHNLLKSHSLLFLILENSKQPFCTLVYAFHGPSRPWKKGHNYSESGI